MGAKRFPALSVNSLRKVYASGTVAIDRLSLDVQEGEFFGLLGANGAGKTTLISCLGGLTRPTEGVIRVFGVDCALQRREAARRVGIVPQEITFDPFLTVRETLRFQSGYWGLRRNDDWIDEILFNLGLDEKAGELIRALSGGMKRRVLVAQALVHQPDLIVLDEPTAGVDVELRERLWSFIGRLHGEGRTIILTTHHLEEAQALCGRVAIMNRGRLVALDRTETLLSRIDGRIMKGRLTGGELPEALKPDLMRRHGADIVLRVIDARDAADKLAALSSAGIELENLTIDQASLEDVYWAVTASDE